MKRTFFLTIVFFLLTVLPTGACFGPKLYLGTGDRPVDEVLYALVSLYVKEKTGTEVVRVALADADPLEELRRERVDMILFDRATDEGQTLLGASWSLPRLVTGPRPLNDLQFTTFAPAIGKLEGRLRQRHVETLTERVDNGAAALAAVRHFLMEQGWI